MLLSFGLHWHHLWGYSIDWGSVPAWLGSVLTAASVWFALFIIRRDKRAAEYEQIMRLVVRHEYGDVRVHKYTDAITVLNSSDRPFYSLELTLFMDPKDKRKSPIAQRRNLLSE